MNRISQDNRKILIADDDPGIRLILRSKLEAEKFEVKEAENGKKAFEILSEEPDIRLVLTDLAMPEEDGYALIKNIRKSEGRYTYIIVLTAMDDKESLIKALSLGADDYLTKPFYPAELKLRLNGGNRLIKLETQEELIFSMAKLSEYRSEETGFHLERVSHYTRLLARDISKNHPALGVSVSMADEIARVSPLHDIGKVAIADSILNKPGKYSDQEFQIMKTHAAIGGKLLRNIYESSNSNYLWIAYEIAMFHHEKWDGKGYPAGIAGYDIPISARIMALADVYDALTSKRCYKDSYSHDIAKSIILEGKGHHFDPVVVDSFLHNEDEWLSIKREYAE